MRAARKTKGTRRESWKTTHTFYPTTWTNTRLLSGSNRSIRSSNRVAPKSPSKFSSACAFMQKSPASTSRLPRTPRTSTPFPRDSNLHSPAIRNSNVASRASSAGTPSPWSSVPTASNTISAATFRRTPLPQRSTRSASTISSGPAATHSKATPSTSRATHRPEFTRALFLKVASRRKSSKIFAANSSPAAASAPILTHG